VATVTNELREQALLLGPRHSIVGVMTPPTGGIARSDATFLILNAGVIHRVGANRLHVHLARDLAHVGIPVLRFDLSGIGDSPNRRDANESVIETAMRDIRDVVDYVCGTTRRVVLLGLCSGAANALLYGARDPRVAGVVLMDLWIPRTRGYHLRRMWRRISRRRSWVTLVRGRANWMRKGLRRWLRPTAPAARNGDAMRAGFEEAEQDPALETAPQITEDQAREILTDAFRPVLARRTPMLAAFTAGHEHQHNYATQIIDAFPELDLRGSMQLDWFPNSDHSFSDAGNANRLRSLVVDWARAHFVAAAKTPGVG
jgi:pimeloyl-ACP methyl ester carboxylesterase